MSTAQSLVPEVAIPAMADTSTTEEVAAPCATPLSTAAVITGMLRSARNVSDLIFSPGRPPQVEVSGQLYAVKVPGLTSLTPADTARIARDLIGENKVAAQALADEGAADLSYSIHGVGRFRTNIFRQRGSHAIVMRAIATRVPTFEELGLPDELRKVAQLKNGIVLVTGPTGSGKSSTLAAVIDLINSTKAEHIITIEDPIEFVHSHKKGTIHQRELHMDTFSFASALRAALRQAPKVILVGEMRDRETIDIALTAAETGHLVLSTLHTIDAAKTVERIIGSFPLSEQEAIRIRVAATFRYFIAQRLMPRKDGSGRVAAHEILKSTLRTKQYIEQGDKEGRSLLDAMRDGDTDGMQHFDRELERMMREGIISFGTAMQYATNPGNLRLSMADCAEEE